MKKDSSHLSYIMSTLAHITQEKFDASLMHVMPEVAAQERMVDDGTGQVEVSVITNPTDRGRDRWLWFHILSYLNSSFMQSWSPQNPHCAPLGCRHTFHCEHFRCGGLRIWNLSRWILNGTDTSTEETATSFSTLTWLTIKNATCSTFGR